MFREPHASRFTLHVFVLGDSNMQTVVTKRGQTVIPAAIRKRYQIQGGDQLVWLDDGETIRVVPVPADPLRALSGSGRGERLVERLLAARREDRKREH
jgi:AbrB family looped-hinge helix DNA binding protein